MPWVFIALMLYCAVGATVDYMCQDRSGKEAVRAFWIETFAWFPMLVFCIIEARGFAVVRQIKRRWKW